MRSEGLHSTGDFVLENLSTGHCPKHDNNFPKDFPDNLKFQESVMGVEPPISPIAMNARRPGGRPAAGIITIE